MTLRDACACLTTFASASEQTKYAAASTSGDASAVHQHLDWNWLRSASTGSAPASPSSASSGDGDPLRAARGRRAQRRAAPRHARRFSGFRRRPAERATRTCQIALEACESEPGTVLKPLLEAPALFVSRSTSLRREARSSSSRVRTSACSRAFAASSRRCLDSLDEAGTSSTAGSCTSSPPALRSGRCASRVAGPRRRRTSDSPPAST